MKIKDLCEEAIKELKEEDSSFVKAEVKERLREIRVARKTLSELESQYEDLLEKEIDDVTED